jgi:hypothetical protein
MDFLQLNPIGEHRAGIRLSTQAAEHNPAALCA